MFRKIFFLFLFLPLLLIPIDFNNYSESEKRTLVSFKLTNFSSFFNDHFPFREELISSYIFINHLIGVSVHPNLFIGDDGYLFLKHQDNITNKQRNIIYPTKSQLDNIEKNLLKVYEYASKKNLSLFFIPVPDQQTVHYLKLPKWHTKLNEFNKYNEFKKIFTEIGRPLNFIDLREDLISNNKPESPTYYQYEGHWSTFGSYIAATTIMSELKIADNNSYSFSEASFIRPDLLLTEKVRDVQINNIEYQKILILSDKHEKYYKYFSNNNYNNNLLIFGDSFTLENTQFLHYFIRNFSSVSRVSSNHQKINNSLINKIKPNTIFICVVERNFFTPELFQSIADSIKN